MKSTAEHQAAHERLQQLMREYHEAQYERRRAVVVRLDDYRARVDAPCDVEPCA